MRRWREADQIVNRQRKTATALGCHHSFIIHGRNACATVANGWRDWLAGMTAFFSVIVVVFWSGVSFVHYYYLFFFWVLIVQQKNLQTNALLQRHTGNKMFLIANKNHKTCITISTPAFPQIVKISRCFYTLTRTQQDELPLCPPLALQCDAMPGNL